MLFGGLQKSSLIDYPGKVSCVLFFSGCNFDCPFCHNPDLAKGNLLDSHSFSERDVCSFLARRKGFLDGVVLSGGEPTIQDDLPAICRKIKQLGYPVKLDTNGSRPHILERLLEDELVDYIAMDIKTDPPNYSLLTKQGCQPNDILSSIRIIMTSAIDYEFRTTCIKPFVNVGVIERISKHIEGAMLYALQRFHHAAMLHPEFFKNNEIGYDDDVLDELKSTAAPWVKKCIIR